MTARAGRGAGNGTGIPKADSPLGQFIARKKAALAEAVEGARFAGYYETADDEACWHERIGRIEAARTHQELEEVING